MRIGVILGSSSGMIRRMIVPTDGEVIDPSHVRMGETLIEIEAASVDIGVVAEAVTAATGRAPPNPRCAVVRNGRVVGIISADPAIDMVPDAELVLSGAAQVGMTYDPVAGFQAAE